MNIFVWLFVKLTDENSDRKDSTCLRLKIKKVKKERKKRGLQCQDWTLYLWLSPQHVCPWVSMVTNPLFLLWFNGMSTPIQACVRGCIYILVWNMHCNVPVLPLKKWDHGQFYSDGLIKTVSSPPIPLFCTIVFVLFICLCHSRQCYPVCCSESLWHLFQVAEGWWWCCGMH